MSKYLILISFLVLLFLNSFAQPLRQWKVEEVVGLFDKPQSEVYKYLSKKHYSYIGNEGGYEQYENRNGLGTIHLNLQFKNAKLFLIGTEESFVEAQLVANDLLENYFKVFKSIDEVKELIPHQSCLYDLKNKKLGLLAVYLIPISNPYLVCVSYQLDSKNKAGGSLSLKLKALKAGNSK